MQMSSSELNGRIRYPFREIMNHGKEIGTMISRQPNSLHKGPSTLESSKQKRGRHCLFGAKGFKA